MKKPLKISTLLITASLALLILNGCGNKPSKKMIEDAIIESNSQLENDFSGIKIDFSMDKVLENTIRVTYTVAAKAEKDRFIQTGMDSKSNGKLGIIGISYWEPKEKKGETYKYKGGMLMTRYGKEWNSVCDKIIESLSNEEIQKLKKISFGQVQYFIKGKNDKETYELTKKLFPWSEAYIEEINPIVKKNENAIENYFTLKEIAKNCQEKIDKIEKEIKQNQPTNNQQQIEKRKKAIEFLKLDIKDFNKKADAELEKLKKLGLTEETIGKTNIKADNFYKENIWRETTKYKTEYKKYMSEF